MGIKRRADTSWKGWLQCSDYFALRRLSRSLAAADLAEIAAARSARSYSNSSRNLISMKGEMTESSARPVEVPDLLRKISMRREPIPKESIR